MDGVDLARARCAAAAVSARLTAYKQHYVARFGDLTYYVGFGSRRDDKARFEAFCDVSRVVHFAHETRSETYLIAVRGKARRRGFAYHSLRKLALKRLFYGRVYVRRAVILID